MFPFYPFLYDKKTKENFQQIPLYIEEYIYPLKEDEEKEEKEKETIIIIDLI